MRGRSRHGVTGLVKITIVFLHNVAAVRGGWGGAGMQARAMAVPWRWHDAIAMLWRWHDAFVSVYGVGIMPEAAARHGGCHVAWPHAEITILSL